MTDTTYSTKSLTVKCPEEFTGKQEHWEKWKQKYTNYTCSVDWRYGKLFELIEQMPRDEKVTKDWIDDWDLNNPVLKTSDKQHRDVMQLSNDLFAQLSDLCQGNAGNLCKRHSKARCGLSVWKELCQHYGIRTSLQLRGKLAKIMSFPLPEADFYNQFTAWQTLIAEYEEEVDKELDEDIKTAHIAKQVTRPLQAHLKLSPAITEFEETCELIHNYYAPTKTEYDKKEETGVNALGWNWKGQKGKGSGKGQGKKGNWQKGNWQKGLGGKGNWSGNGKGSQSSGNWQKGYWKGGKGKAKGKGTGKGYWRHVSKGKGKGKGKVGKTDGKSHEEINNAGNWATQNYKASSTLDPNVCKNCGKTGHWAKDCWSKRTPMDIGFVWDDDGESYWVYEEEEGNEEEWEWKEGEGEWTEGQDESEIPITACFSEWGVNFISTGSEEEDNNNTTDHHDNTCTFSLQETTTTDHCAGDHAVTATVNHNCHETENHNDHDHRLEETAVNALTEADLNINWEAKDRLMMDSGAGVCVSTGLRH